MFGSSVKQTVMVALSFELAAADPQTPTRRASISRLDLAPTDQAARSCGDTGELGIQALREYDSCGKTFVSLCPIVSLPQSLAVDDGSSRAG